MDVLAVVVSDVVEDGLGRIGETTVDDVHPERVFGAIAETDGVSVAIPNGEEFDFVVHADSRLLREIRDESSRSRRA